MFLYIFLTYVVLTFICAALWHMLFFKKIYDALGVFTRKDPIIPLGISSMILQGLVVAYTFPLFVHASNYPLQGAMYGVLFIGFFMGSNAVLAEAAKNEVGSLKTWVPLEMTYYMLQGLIVGSAIGALYLL